MVLLRSRSRLALGLFALIAACSSANAETNSRVIPPPSAPQPSAPAAPQAAVPAARASSAQATRVVYDLAAHVEHAELRRGDSLILDLGETSGAKYALGGWGTRVVPGLSIDGASTAF